MRTSTRRDEPDLHSLVHRRRDAVQHRQRMSFIICILKTADDRMRGSHQLRELPLGQPGFGAKIVNLACHGVVGLGPLKLRLPVWFTQVLFLVDVFKAIGSVLFRFFHNCSFV